MLLGVDGVLCGLSLCSVVCFFLLGGAEGCLEGGDGVLEGADGAVQVAVFEKCEFIFDAFDLCGGCGGCGGGGA